MESKRRNDTIENNMSKTYTLVFEDQAFAKLEEMRGAANATSQSQVVRKALSVYAFLLQKAEEGFRIQLTDGRSTMEVTLVIE